MKSSILVAPISLISRLFGSKGWSNYLVNWSDLFQKMGQSNLEIRVIRASNKEPDLPTIFIYSRYLPRQFISQYSQYPWTCFPANTKVEHQYFSSVGSHIQFSWTFPWNSNGKMQSGIGPLTVVQFNSEKKIAQKVHWNILIQICKFLLYF